MRLKDIAQKASLDQWYTSIDRWNCHIDRERVITALEEEHETYGGEDIMSVFVDGVEFSQVDCDSYQIRGFCQSCPDERMITATVEVFEDHEGEIRINSVSLSTITRK